MIGLDITPADVQDRDGGIPMLKGVRRQFPFLKAVIADGGCQGVETAAAVYRAAKAPLQIVKRSDAANGFQVLHKSWIIEPTFGWLGRCRRLAKDSENLTRSKFAFVKLVMIRLLMHRIAKDCKS
jgi:transposase